MKKNEDLEELLKLEKEYRNQENHSQCMNICLKILNEIQDFSQNQKFDIISKLFLYENQSNYVRIHLMHELFQNNNFINSISIKKKYYQLLIDSLKQGNSSDLSEEKNEIIKLYEKSSLNNFEEIDKYIVNIVSDIYNIDNIKINNDINYIMSSELQPLKKTKSFNEIKIKSTPIESSDKRLDPLEALSPQSCVQTSFEDFNTNRPPDFNFSVQKIISPSENSRNKIKELMKKYKPNLNLPLIIISVSANLNRSQFLELIKNIFIKMKYRLVCNIKDSEYENINIY